MYEYLTRLTLNPNAETSDLVLTEHELAGEGVVLQEVRHAGRRVENGAHAGEAVELQDGGAEGAVAAAGLGATQLLQRVHEDAEPTQLDELLHPGGATRLHTSTQRRVHVHGRVVRQCDEVLCVAHLKNRRVQRHRAVGRRRRRRGRSISSGAAARTALLQQCMRHQARSARHRPMFLKR